MPTDFDRSCRALTRTGSYVPSIALSAGDSVLLQQFAVWQHGRAFSPNTVRRRNVALRSLAAFVYPAAYGEVTGALVEEWVRSRKAARTRHAYRSDASTFYGWAVKRGLLTANPVDLTDSIRVPKSLPRPVDPELVPQIVTSASDPDTRLMVALAAYAGLRRSEIAVLESDAVSLHSVPPMLAVRNGKGGKDRLVPIHPALAKLLGARRTTGRYFGLTPDAVGRRVSAHLQACGVDATCHQLRHSFGTEAARVSGGNLVMVGRMMGHADTNTTLGYCGWAGGEGSSAVAAMFGGVA